MERAESRIAYKYLYTGSINVFNLVSDIVNNKSGHLSFNNDIENHRHTHTHLTDI
jgi:hypothetical protein